MHSIFIKIVLLILFCSLPVHAEVLSEDTKWQGVVELHEDVLVIAGVTLTIEPGTRIKIWPAENTKIDPEYMSHQTEILVRGKLVSHGKNGNEIVFSRADSGQEERWAGIIVDQGKVDMSNCRITGAEAAVSILAGDVFLADSQIYDNRYGLVGQGTASSLQLQNLTVEKNDYGVMLYDNAFFVKDQGTKIRSNSKNDFLSGSSAAVAVKSVEYESTVSSTPVVYRDEALAGHTVWKGRVLIDGQLRLPPGSRLIILPGTVIEFIRKDTNNDGIGENGLQIQGQIIAKGTAEKPILFRSGEANRSRGDWDSINILGSDLSQSILEYCQIEDAYRGMHFHYSNVAVNRTVLRNNYRGIQFQESLVSLTANQFYNNISGIQCRDSDVFFQNNEIFHNLAGANFFRLNLTATNNIFANNYWDGLRIREGASVVSNNLLAGNRMGLLIADAVYGNFSANVMSGNLESGVLIRDTDHIEIVDNAIFDNGITGISLKDTRASIKNNLIIKNGERGIGIISFNGQITKNNIANNGIYAIGLEDSGDIDATGNWWGQSDLDKEIFDINDEPSLGRVSYGSQLATPVSFTWPLLYIKSDSSWAGIIHVRNLLEVADNSILTVMPGSSVIFSEEAGLMVNGALKANGTPEHRIIFTSFEKSGPGDWTGIRLERAAGSEVKYCDFSYAEWGLHVHFVPMEINKCRFISNDVGLKFRSGPMRLSRSFFSGNRIAIRSFLGKMDIFENEITENEIGVFIREGGKDIKIYRNNLHNNERYNLRLGDFNKDDVDARNNWWGTDNPQEKIFDRRMESYIGQAIFEPVLEYQLELEVNGPIGKVVR